MGAFGFLKKKSKVKDNSNLNNNSNSIAQEPTTNQQLPENPFAPKNQENINPNPFTPMDQTLNQNNKPTNFNQTPPTTNQNNNNNNNPSPFTPMDQTLNQNNEPTNFNQTPPTTNQNNNNNPQSFTQEPTMNQSIPNIPFNQPPFIENQDTSEESLKEHINADVEPKTNYDSEEINKEKEYIDEVLENDFDLKSVENLKKNNFENKPNNKDELKKKKELKKKIDNHNEIIHVDIEDENIEKDHALKNNIKIESPEDLMNDNNEIPEFETSNDDEISTNIKELKKNKITGDLFIKTTLYGEVLYSNLIIQKDANLCIENFKQLNMLLKSQEKGSDNLKSEFDDLRKNITEVEEILFNNNPLMR